VPVALGHGNDLRASDGGRGGRGEERTIIAALTNKIEVSLGYSDIYIYTEGVMTDIIVNLVTNITKSGLSQPRPP
jgi:hypothetical protein